MTIFTKLTTLHDDVADIDYDLPTTSFQALHDAILADSGMSENRLKQFDSETIASLPAKDFDNDEHNKAELLRQATNFNEAYLETFKHDFFSRVHKALYFMQLTCSRILKSETVIEENGHFISIKDYSDGKDDKYNQSRFKSHTTWNGTSPNPELDPVKALAEIDEEYTRLKTALGLSDKICKSTNQERIDYLKALENFSEKYQTIEALTKFVNDVCLNVSYDETFKGFDDKEIINHIDYDTFLSRPIDEFLYIRPHDYKAHYNEKIRFAPITCAITDDFSDYQNDKIAQSELPILQDRKHALADKNFGEETQTKAMHRQRRAIIGSENYSFIVEITQDKLILLDGFNRLFGNDFPLPDKKVMVKVYHDLSEKQYSDVVYCVNDWKTKGQKFGSLFYDRGVRASLFIKYSLFVSQYPIIINTKTSENLVEHVRDTNLLTSMGDISDSLRDTEYFIAGAFNAIRRQSKLTKKQTSELLIAHKVLIFDTLRVVNDLVQQPTKDRVFNEMIDRILAK